MGRLLPILLVFFAGCTAKPISEAKPALPAPRAPFKYSDYNIVFVSFDALQAAHVGHLGYSRNVTPTIDAAARRGISFTRAYSVASWTVPASMTWFTGVYPSEHRMVNKFAVYNATQKKPANLKELAPDLVTLAEVMRENGYATGGFTGNAGVSGGFGYEQGFDVYFHEKNVFGGFEQSLPKAIEWIKTNREKKLFVFLHGYDAHGQNTPAAGYDFRFVDKGYDRRYTGSEQEQEALREEGLEKGQLTLRDSDVRFWRAVYDEKIQRADERFKKFLADYDRLGLTDKTVFVLTSDHGTELYEHRRFDHGYALFDVMLHVPLVVRLPDRTLEKAVADRVSSIDVMPTLLDLMDVRVSEKVRRQMRGSSLVPAMKGDRVERSCFSETDYREYTFQRSVIAPDGWKLIVTLDKKRRELFDLTRDPDEANDRAVLEPKRADELEKNLYQHFKSIGHDLTAREWKPGLNPVYASQGK